MNRVLVTGGAGSIGAAVVRRLLRDPNYEVRVSDRREAPTWMREGCEVHTGDLRQLSEARKATSGCSHVVHLAAMVGGIGSVHRTPHTLMEVNHEVSSAVMRAALDRGLERFVYVSSNTVLERATVFPTPESHLADCPPPHGADGISKLFGELAVRAAHAEHGLPFTICRPFSVYGPGELPAAEPGVAHVVPDLVGKAIERPVPLPIFGSGRQTRTPTFVDDAADGIVVAMAAPEGLDEDFNLCGGREVTVAELAAIVWTACGHDPEALELAPAAPFAFDAERSAPSPAKARDRLGWTAPTPLEAGIATTVAWLRERIGASPATVPA